MFRDFTKYDVLADGRIWSKSHKKFLKPRKNKHGYLQVNLSDNNNYIKNYQHHRVIYEAVTGQPIPEGYDVNHIDECKTNNSFDNLNLMTRAENNAWGTRTERHVQAMTNNPKISKRVAAYDKNGELVMIFASTREAGRQGFQNSHVSACCRGERKTHKGYEWRYLDDNE